MNFNKPEIARSIAIALIKTKAIVLSPKKPFTWASGWGSPIYCDNRKTLSYPEARGLISSSLLKAIEFHFPDIEMIAGVATAGIPQASILADRLALPLVYVRDKSKAHGMENKIEGEIKGGEKCLVVEDLISTAGSSIKAASALKSSGVNVVGLISTFSYGFEEAIKNLENAGLNSVSLCNYRELLPIALEEKIISKEDLSILEAWRIDPAHWTP
jgi:orotate phosphoribosyltransferase